MPKYVVLAEQKVAEHIEVDADSHEQAVARAEEVIALWTTLPAKVVLRPTWVGTKAHSDSHGEYEFEVIGPCDWCKTPLISRDIPDQPWNYDTDPENEHGGLVCYPCIKGRGLIDEKGNVKRSWR